MCFSTEGVQPAYFADLMKLTTETLTRRISRIKNGETDAGKLEKNHWKILLSHWGLHHFSGEIYFSAEMNESFVYYKVEKT